MKKVLMFAIFAVLLVGFVFALNSNSNSLSNSNDDDEDNSLISANDNSDEDELSENEKIEGEGIVKFVDVEGGCWIIETDDGIKYEPTNLNESYKQNGLKVEFEGKIQENMTSVCQVGTLIKLTEIESDDEDECEAWNCIKWSPCLNETKTRTCTKNVFNCTEDNKKPKLTKECDEKEEFKFHGKLRDCPEGCVCSGSTIKCTFENGTRVMTIYAGKSGNVIVQIQNMNMSTNVTLYRNDEGKVYGKFKNNETKEIKMPDEIKEKLQNRTKVKLYNESMDLDEEGDYHMNAQKKARLFWMVPVREKVEYSIDSETGEVISTKTIWWGFLAKDIKEKSED
ncbi:MAG: hypothetical protein AABY32_03640 [Nanoarchaeota archaeon]